MIRFNRKEKVMPVNGIDELRQFEYDKLIRLTYGIK